MEAERKIFEPIDLDSVAEAVVVQIERLIIGGVLKGGQKLPSERELSESMDVSRPKVREAIKILEDRDLLTVRHGEGTFVKPLAAAALSPTMIDLFARHPSAFYDYLEFRREVEGFAAFAAAQRATSEDKEILRRKLADMEEAHLKGDDAREAEVDVAFHISIVDAAHNAMLIHMMASIYQLMSRGVFYNRKHLIDLNDARDALLDQHRAIAMGVLDGDPEAAANAAEAHMDFVENRFRDSDDVSRRASLARKRLLLVDSDRRSYRQRASRSVA
jgi:GntR family transcriptional repressor for pyruvate dehydrogenase complex